MFGIVRQPFYSPHATQDTADITATRAEEERILWGWIEEASTRTSTDAQ